MFFVLTLTENVRTHAAVRRHTVLLSFVFAVAILRAAAAGCCCCCCCWPDAWAWCWWFGRRKYSWNVPGIFWAALEQALYLAAEMENVRSIAKRDAESARLYAVQKFAKQVCVPSTWHVSAPPPPLSFYLCVFSACSVSVAS